MIKEKLEQGAKTDINYYETLNLKRNPFEAQGEFDPEVSSETPPIRTNFLRIARESIRMASHDKKLIVATVIGEPGAGKTDLVKRLTRGEEYSEEAKHIYVKMGIGSPTDHLYVLAIIVNKLKEEVDKLDPVKLKDFLGQKKEEIFKSPVKIEGAFDKETVTATRLLNEWYDYISALRNVAGYRSIVVYVDEIEDRWGVRGVQPIQREKDLIYLRDLIGFVQDEKEIAGNFPVALFLCMTAEAYTQIGGVNNALQSRLQRTINLPPFTPDEARMLVREKLNKFRISYKEDEYHPFTKDSVDFLIKNATNEKKFFNFRKFLIDCHDCLYHFAEKSYLDKTKDGLIDHKSVLDWYSLRGEAVSIGEGEYPPEIVTPEILDIKVREDIDAQRTWNSLKKDLLGNYEKQFQRAVRNLQDLLLYASPDNITRSPESNTLYIKIPDANARVPVKILTMSEGKDKKAIFTLYVTDKEVKHKLSENEYVFQLPKERMMRYAIFSPENILVGAEKERSVRDVREQIQGLMEKVKDFFENHKKEHYVPISIPTTDKKLEGVFENLTKFVVSGDKRGIEKNKLMDLDVYETNKIKDPYWFMCIKSEGEFEDTRYLWENVFYFNSEEAPIRGCLDFLTALRIIENGKIKTIDSFKLSLSKQIEEYVKDLTTKIKYLRKDVGGDLPEKVEKDINTIIEDLNRINREEILKFKPKPTSTIENFVVLYNNEKKVQSMHDSMVEHLMSIGGLVKKYVIMNTRVKNIQGELKKQRFKDKDRYSKFEKFLPKTERIFQEMDKNKINELEKEYNPLVAEAEKFISDSEEVEKKLSEFDYKELSTAISEGYLEKDLKDIEGTWNNITVTDNLQKAKEGLSFLESHFALLREEAEKHLRQLREKQRSAIVIINQIKGFVDSKRFGPIDKTYKQIENTLRACTGYYEHDNYCELLKENIEKEYKGLIPSIRDLFQKNKDYSVNEIAKIFGIDEKDAREFAKIMEQLDVLKSYYRVVD